MLAKELTIDALVDSTNYAAAKLLFVKQNFPDAKPSRPTFNSNFEVVTSFKSKLVNSVYDKLDFVKKYQSLYVMPYSELFFSYNGKEELIKISSSPKINRLVYMDWRTGPDGKKKIKFSRLTINLKNNHFKDDMLNACRVRIMQFVKDNPNCTLDPKHLEPRLKKVLIFV